MEEVTRREMLGRSIRITGATLLGIAPIGAATMGTQEESVEKRKILVAGAHPDDPETGCGGTMARFAGMGHEVVALYLTRGEAGIPGKSHQEAATIRTGEAQKACDILNMRPLFAGQIDGATEITPRRYDEVYNIIKMEAPDILFVHWPVDSHRDHRICSILVYDAWLRMGKPVPLYYYEVMSGIQTQQFLPSHYVDITQTAEQKHRACFAHTSQKIKQSYPHDHGKMEAFRGLEYGCDAAEAFIRHSQSFTLPPL